MKRLLLVFLSSCISLCGCKLKYEDISKDPEYASLLNTSYSLTANMLIYGVDLPPGYGRGIDIYTIKPKGIKITGREIITEEILEIGTVIVVQGVRRSTNHFPGFQSIDVEVEVSLYEDSVIVPIVMDIKYLKSTKYMRKN